MEDYRESEFLLMASRLHTLEVAQRERKAEIDRLRGALSRELDRVGKDAVKAGALTVRRTSYERSHFDAGAFKAEYPRLYAKYAGSQTVRKLEVVG